MFKRKVRFKSIEFKKYFKVEKYFESIVVEDTLWNEAYILLSKIDKKYRLILAHYGAHPGQDQIELISTKKNPKSKNVLDQRESFAHILSGLKKDDIFLYLNQFI